MGMIQIDATGGSKIELRYDGEVQPSLSLLLAVPCVLIIFLHEPTSLQLGKGPTLLSYYLTACIKENFAFLAVGSKAFKGKQVLGKFQHAAWVLFPDRIIVHCIPVIPVATLPVT